MSGPAALPITSSIHARRSNSTMPELPHAAGRCELERPRVRQPSGLADVAALVQLVGRLPPVDERDRVERVVRDREAGAVGRIELGQALLGKLTRAREQLGAHALVGCGETVELEPPAAEPLVGDELPEPLVVRVGEGRGVREHGRMMPRW